MKIYFYNNPVLDANDNELAHMLEKGYVVKFRNKYELNEQNEELRYLFSRNTKLFKKLKYLEHINEAHFTCEDCGKPFSFHIRPRIAENGQVDFHTIICVCKECRTKKLEKRDILVPQFKKTINWHEEKYRIKREIEFKHILARKTYYHLNMDIVMLEAFCKLILPPFPEKQNKVCMEEFEYLNEFLGDNIDLADWNSRRKVKEFLFKECRGICPVCGKRMHNSHDLTIDHIIAKSLDGKNSLNNFIGMCESCNKEKDNKTVMEFLCEKQLYKMPPRILREAYKQQEYCRKILNKKKQELKNII